VLLDANQEKARAVTKKKNPGAAGTAHGAHDDEHRECGPDSSKNQSQKLDPDRGQIETYVRTLFRHATPGSWVSVRAFPDDDDTKPFCIKPVELNGSFEPLIDQIYDVALQAANATRKVVVCPPGCTFINAEHARQQDIRDGLDLTVELDHAPQASLETLEKIIGPATMVVESGGITAEGEPKLHGRWVLAVPARTKAELDHLKEARIIACAIVGGDPTHAPISHPIRCPGTWHRKNEPRLCRIRDHRPDVEIDLPDALEKLKTVATPKQKASASGQGTSDYGELIEAVLKSENYHDSINRLASKVISNGLHTDKAIRLLQGLMKNAKGPRDARWQVRYNDIARAVLSADEKFGHNADKINLEDFVAYLPEHNYVYMRTRAYWPGSSVDARLPRVKIGVREDGTPITISPSDWLDLYRRVEVQTWMPGQPVLIKGHEFTEDDGLVPMADSTVYNQYRPPTIKLGDPKGATRWLDLIEELYPNNKDHIVSCCAHARQRPQIKINHALVLGGDQGIGKDTIFAGLERAVGFSNFRPITPSQVIDSQFNGELKCVVLYISEVHDLGIGDRIKFYNMMKDKLATPPTTIRINEKYRQPFYIPNLLFAVMTTNFQTGGIYLPPNDRRHYVGWSSVKKGDHTKEWWDDYYKWFNSAGDECIAGFLQAYDLSDFNPKAEPLKTEAWHAMVNASRSSEEMELTDVLETFKGGAATLIMIRNEALSLGYQGLADWLDDPRNHKATAARLEDAGYTVIRNPDDERGRWRVLQADGGTRPRVIYGPSTLSTDHRVELARKLKDVEEPKKALRYW
jgi:uncharacterized protein DUF5906